MRRIPFLQAVCALLLCLSLPTHAEDAHKYGKKMVAAYELPEATLRAMQNFKPSARDPKATALENMVSAKTEDWIGPDLPFVMEQNPYTIVIRMQATALADGAASSLWLGGWSFTDEKGVQGVRSNPVTGLTEPNARAGQSLTLVATTGPVSVKQNRMMAPALSLTNIQNMRIESIRVEIWSGAAGNSATQLFLSLQWLWIGLVMLVLWWFWFKR